MFTQLWYFLFCVKISPLRKEFMPKFIDEVLSEIVGVPCGDITFSLCVESVGQTLGAIT